MPWRYQCPHAVIIVIDGTDDTRLYCTECKNTMVCTSETEDPTFVPEDTPKGETH